MTFRVGPGGRGNSLVIEGELDLASINRLVTAIDLCVAPTDEEVIIDVGGLTFLDGTGAQVLIDMADKLPDGARVVLVGGTGIVARLLELIRMDTHPRIELRP